MSILPWALYTAIFGTWATLALATRGASVSAWLLTGFATFGAVMTVRTYRRHLRFMREHEAHMAEIRAKVEAWVAEQHRRARQHREFIERLKNAPHN